MYDPTIIIVSVILSKIIENGHNTDVLVQCQPGISTMSYSDRLRTLRLPSLVYRRARGDMIETYKFLHNVYDLNNEWLRGDPSTRTRGHSLKLEKRRCQTTMRQHCFSNRIINNWNSLPESIISAPTVNNFKSKLDQHWYNHI